MKAIDLIVAERIRQVEVEGYDAEHDSDHDHDSGQLVRAAIAYARRYSNGGPFGHDEMQLSVGLIRHSEAWWPWTRGLKPTTSIRDLVKSAALLAAEIDRRIDLGEQP